MLADVNADGGQDFLAVINCGPLSSAQVLFGNGQTPATLTSRTTFRLAFQVFQVDFNRDGIPDAGVIDDADDGTFRTRYFINDGHGAFTEVTTSAAAATRQAVTSQAALATATAEQERFRRR